MKYAKVRILMASVALLGLVACDKAGQPSSQTAAGSASGEDSAEKKLNTYVEAHNKFIDTFGFVEKAEAYRKTDVAHASVDGTFNVSAGWIGQGLEKLKEARASAGGPADLDTAADALISSMGKVQTHLASLETYYSSKKYLDDNLARGKAEDRQMLAELDASEKDFERFGAQLDLSLDKRDQALLETLKGSDPLKYNAKLALMHAKKLMNLFNGPDDLNRPDIFAKGDAEVAIIEKAIADAHDEAVKKGKSDPSGLSSLTSMLGSYRTLKQRHEASDAQSMLRQYNQAVDSSNTWSSVE
jgi:hypothetical protein